jgi:hypothetical protein
METLLVHLFQVCLDDKPGKAMTHDVIPPPTSLFAPRTQGHNLTLVCCLTIQAKFRSVHDLRLLLLLFLLLLHVSDLILFKIKQFK